MMGRSGVALLEVIVAIAIISAVAISTMGLASSSAAAVDEANRLEEQYRRAAGLLAAVSVWPRVDLDRHLGRTQQGPVDLLLSRPAAELYQLTTLDRATGQPLLHTALYRPEAGS